MKPRLLIVALAAGAALLTGGSVAVAGLGQASSGSSTDDELSPEKAALAAEDAKYDEQQAAIGRDPEAFAALVKAKQRAQRENQASGSEEPLAVDDWPVGIFDDPEVPAPGSLIIGRNRWVGLVDGHSIAVYAGVAGDDPKVGRVLIQSAASNERGERGTYLDLPGSGALMVVEAQGSIVVVADESGTEHALDARTWAWIK